MMCLEEILSIEMRDAWNERWKSVKSPKRNERMWQVLKEMKDFVTYDKRIERMWLKDKRNERICDLWQKNWKNVTKWQKKWKNLWLSDKRNERMWLMTKEMKECDLWQKNWKNVTCDKRIERMWLSDKRNERMWLNFNFKFKIIKFTTFSDGCLGSRNDEGRS